MAHILAQTIEAKLTSKTRFFRCSPNFSCAHAENTQKYADPIGSDGDNKL